MCLSIGEGLRYHPTHLVNSPCRVPSTTTVSTELARRMVKDGRNPASQGAPVMHMLYSTSLRSCHNIELECCATIEEYMV